MPPRIKVGFGAHLARRSWTQFRRRDGKVLTIGMPIPFDHRGGRNLMITGAQRCFSGKPGAKGGEQVLDRMPN